MAQLLLAFGLPTLGFGLFALLALRFGAETRPGFDERPIKDDRPNWYPIPGSGGGSAPAAPRATEPRGGPPVGVAAPARVAPAPAPATVRPRSQAAPAGAGA